MTTPPPLGGSRSALGVTKSVRAAVVSRIAHQASERAAPPRLSARWWEDLPPDFARQDEAFDLGLGDRLQVQGTAAVDVVLRTLGACLVGSLALPLGYHPAELKQALRDGDLYSRLADTGDASQFFHAPPGGVRVTSRPARFLRFRPADASVEDLRFDSPYQTLNPNLRRGYARHRNNSVAHLRLWRHRGAPRPTVVAIHGFSADLYWLNEWFFALPWLYELGFDVGLFTLPFHGKRQTRFSPFSGHGFFAGGPSRINEAFGQAVLDFRIFLDHLLSHRGVPRVGVMGVSLGGYTSALLAATEPRLSFAIPNVPLASLPDLVLEWQPIGAVVRTSMKLFNQRMEDARHLLAVSSPLTYAPLLPRERLMVIGGIGDRLAPPKHSRLLWEHWERCRLHWFPGSHLIHLDRGAYLREIGRFLNDLDFFEGVPPVPRRGRGRAAGV